MEASRIMLRVTPLCRLHQNLLEGPMVQVQKIENTQGHLDHDYRIREI